MTIDTNPRRALDFGIQRANSRSSGFLVPLPNGRSLLNAQSLEMKSYAKEPAYKSEPFTDEKEAMEELGGDVSLDSNMQLGNLFVFINAASYGLYLVIVKPMMKKYHPITVMFYVFSFGLLYVLPFGFTNLADVDWSIIPNSIYLEIAFVVICTTFIAYLFNSAALKQLSPSTVSIYIYLQQENYQGLNFYIFC